MATTSATTDVLAGVVQGGEPTDGANTKILAMFVLGVGSFLAALIPTAISERSTRRFPFLISLLLCFGAGILFATSLVHMLPDVSSQIPKGAEVIFCGGFFIVYFIEELLHYIIGDSVHQLTEAPASRRNSTDTTNNVNHRHYGSNGESESLLRNHHHEEALTNSALPIDMSRDPMTGALGLLIALSIHSFIEGLAIGVQTSQSKILILMIAVASHKYVMAFSLGLVVRTNSNFPFKAQLAAVSVFSLGSVIGIGAGMALVQIPTSLSTSAIPILQGLAGGTLLYVTVIEVIPKEKTMWHNSGRKFAGLAQCFVVGLGFAAMTILNFYLDDDE